jgi:hypothetical protein
MTIGESTKSNQARLPAERPPLFRGSGAKGVAAVEAFLAK